MLTRSIPASFKSNVTGAFPNGAAWLASLPDLIAKCEDRWHIVVGSPFDLSFNYVAPAVDASGREVVLKLGVPSSELSSEIRALETYGDAAVRLLDSDEDSGIMLLECLRPGRPLCDLLDDERETRIAAGIIRDLWRPLPPAHHFVAVSEWASGLAKLRSRFDGGTGPFPKRLVEMAETLFHELLASSAPSVLLHGDLHHGNILSAERRAWVAIDPKGAAGELAYEVGALLRNPNSQLCTNIDVQRRRLAVLEEELGFDKQRMAGWGAAQALLAAWWSLEDGGNEWESNCSCAEVLARFIA